MYDRLTQGTNNIVHKETNGYNSPAPWHYFIETIWYLLRNKVYS